MIKIKNIAIGDNYRTFIIAEVGLSHEGSLGVAISMIDAAAESGADAVKFQMHLAEEESSNFEKFRTQNFLQDKNRYNYWKRTSFTYQEWKLLKNYTQKKKLIFLCSPFSIKAVEILNKLKIDAWKIASGEFNNLFLIDKILEISSKPIILSTGLSEKKEIQSVLNYIKKKRKNLVLLQCFSSYPTKLINVGHKLINQFKKDFNVCSGVSDHSGNLNSLLLSVTLGANVIETHVCFSKNYFGPDTSSSIKFDQLKFLVKFSEDFYFVKKKGTKKKEITSTQKKLRKIFFKGLAFRQNVSKGQVIKKEFLKDIKPLIGIPANNYKKIIGKKAKKNFSVNHIIKMKDLLK